MLSKNGIPDEKLYVIKVYLDGEFDGYFEFDNALEAVNSFNEFTDSRGAKEKLTAYLIEANETVHTRSFNKISP